MLLISLCTCMIIMTLYVGSNRQVVVKNCPGGFKGEWKYSVQKDTYIFLALILILTSTARYGFIDTYAYKEMYLLSRNNLEYVHSKPYDVEAGWLYICYFLNFIAKSPKMILLFSAVCINVTFILLFKKYSCSPLLSFYIYFCLSYLDTNNGLRQLVAASMTLAAFELLVKRKWQCYFLYFIIILLAKQLHESAFAVLFIAFVAVGKPFNFKVKCAIAASAVFLLKPDLGNTLLSNLFEDSKYNKYLSIDIGMSVFRLLATAVVPLILLLLYWFFCKKNKKEITYSEGILINFMVISIIFSFLGMSMQYWVRMSMYTNFSIFILLPKLINDSFVEESARILRIASILCYFFFFVYNVYVNIGYGAIGDFYISWQ